MQTNSAATPLLSVVVPVYKTERWLRRCLDSLLGQSLEEIEVVCVDDASPDGCPCAELGGRSFPCLAKPEPRRLRRHPRRVCRARCARARRHACPQRGAVPRPFERRTRRPRRVHRLCGQRRLRQFRLLPRRAGRRRRRRHGRAQHRARGCAGEPLHSPALRILPL